MSFSSLSLISNYGTKNNKKKVVVVVVNLNKILYYNFENRMATDRFNYYNGTLTTNPPISSNMPKFGSYSLESTYLQTAQCVSLPANIPITSNGLSFALWLYPTSTAAGGDIILLEMNGNGGMNLWCGVNNNNYQWCSGTIFTITKSVWTHLVLTIDSSNNTSVYRNGILVTTDTTAGKYPTNSFIAQGKIGRSISSAHKPFTGYIDEFQIYNKILSVSDIETIYTKVDDSTEFEKAKLVYYNFEYLNGGSATVAKDHYNAFNGVVEKSGISTALPHNGVNSLFNGSGSTTTQSGITMPGFISVNNNGLTFSFWLYTIGNNAGTATLHQRIFRIQTNLHKSAQTYNHRFLSFVNWYGTTNYSLATSTSIGTTSNALAEVEINKFSMTNNEWHFITITINSDDLCNVYVDKILRQSTTFGPSVPSYSAYPVNTYPSPGYPTTTAYPGIYPDIGFYNTKSLPVSTGYNIYQCEIFYPSRTDDGRSHMGYLDEFKIFNKIVTTTEMEALYNNTA